MYEKWCIICVLQLTSFDRQLVLFEKQFINGSAVPKIEENEGDFQRILQLYEVIAK